MKFSIIVPCYNQPQYLFGLLQNVAVATKEQHEVIIINDGSTKSRTKEMIDRLGAAGSHQKIVRIHQANVGLASTRNVGLNVAEGEFLQFLDADDLLVAAKLDRQAVMMDQHGLDIAIDEYMIGDDDLCEFRPGDFVMSDYDLTVENIARKWERGMTIPIHCPLIRRSSLGALRFAEHMRAKEDWFFWMSYFEIPRRYGFTGVVGAIYRVHPQSMTRADSTGAGFQWLSATKVASDRLSTSFDEKSREMAVEHFNSFYVRFFYLKDARFNKRLFTAFLRKRTATQEVRR